LTKRPSLPQLVNTSPLVLLEGAVIERMRRDSPLPLHPGLLNTGFIYSAVGRQVMGRIYRQYLRAASQQALPILVLTPTWRANPERIEEAGLSGKDVNGDAVRFLAGLRDDRRAAATTVLVGGLMGCRGDAYAPSQALARDEAVRFHSPQAQALASAGADFLIASTLPSVQEATGLGIAMARTGRPCILSFVVRAEGVLLDGTPLGEAISLLDASISPRPFGYMANCVHPSNFRGAMVTVLGYSPQLAVRVLGLQGNTSLRSPEELDGSPALEAQEDPELFAEAMLGLNREYGLKLLGGCCGTDDRHIKAIAKKWREAHPA
jgi:homocysteine S-methyltransferase